ncbi:MAG: helix-turn-helix transcriptional regulator [Clostridia bacterium]|nr:helix-turn-helix transcriptional regulator [Clostridia bacterium]
MKPVKLSYNLDISDKSSWLTVTAAPSVRSSFAYVQELGDFYCGSDYFTVRENLPSYLIKLALNGAGTLEYENATYQIRPGRLFWVDCRKHQRYYTSPDAPSWHTLWVHLYGPTAQAYYEAFLEQNNGSAMVSADHPSSMLDLFSQLMALYRGNANTIQDDIQASCLLTQLMTGCIRLSGQGAGTRQKPGYIASVQEYIDTHYAEDITLDVLARQFSIDKYHLQKMFKQRVGLSPNAYLTRSRLAAAKQLLRTTGDSMTRIAEEVGYTASYFDNVFKKYEGVTPRAYRQGWYDSEKL